MTTTWLRNQKIGELKELAEASALQGYEKLKKDDLIPKLDEWLRENAPRFASNPRFEEYYNRATSPLKREHSTGAARKTARKTIGPTVKAEDEVEVRTPPQPKPAQRKSTGGATPRSTKIGLPSTPQAVVNLVERQSARFTNSALQQYERSPIPEYVSYLQHSLSSVSAVESLSLFVELVALLSNLIPLRDAFTFPLPFASVVGLKSPVQVSLPDFFVLATNYFWSPVLLWATVTTIIPAIVARFINFTGGPRATRRTSAASRQIDPVVFNVTRALAVWLVFTKGWRISGFVTRVAVVQVEQGVWGGVPAMLVGAGIASLAGFYDAVLKAR